MPSTPLLSTQLQPKSLPDKRRRPSPGLRLLPQIRLLPLRLLYCLGMGRSCPPSQEQFQLYHLIQPLFPIPPLSQVSRNVPPLPLPPLASEVLLPVVMMHYL